MDFLNSWHQRRFRIMTAAFFLLTVLTLVACPVQAQIDKYADGIYEGEFSFIKVRVTVTDGKISAIEILQHGGGGEKYEKMIQPLTTAIIENQSLDVDGITGATVSSQNLIEAIRNALQKQAKNE